MGALRLLLLSLALGGCGRFGYEPAGEGSDASVADAAAGGADGQVSDGSAPPDAPAEGMADAATAGGPDASAPDAAVPDAALPDASVPDAAAFDTTGTYLAGSPISYSCAGGLVDAEVTAFFFSDDGSTITVSTDDPGSPAQPCQMSGPSPGDGTFDVTCTIPAMGPGCDETYTLSGSFAGADSWSGTLTMDFQGSCLDCAMQSFAVSGSRCTSGCPAPP